MNKIGRAFTLMELLVVIAIISLLAAILFPVFNRVRENARRSSCQSNLKQIGLGLLQYTQDNDDRMPFVQVGQNDRSGSDDDYEGYIWQDAIYPYIKNEQVFNCPSMVFGKPGGTLTLPYKYSDPVNEISGPAVRGTYKKYIGSYTINAAYLRHNVGYGIGSNPLLPGVVSAVPGSGAWISTASGAPYVATLPAIEAPATTFWVGEHNGNDNGGTGFKFTIQISVLGDGTNVFSYSTGVSGGDGPILKGYLGMLTQRHLETQNVLFCDGHVKAMKLDQLLERSSRTPNVYKYMSSWDD